MISRPTARIATVALLGGLLIPPLLNDGKRLSNPAIDVVSVQAPRFRISWFQNQLRLAGHTQSGEHEQLLSQVVEVSFDEASAQTRFEPLGVLPNHWTDTTTQILFLIAESDASIAEISASSVSIRAVTSKPVAWQSRLNAVRENLPTSLALSADTVLIDRTIKVAQVCERAFDEFDVGAVNFEESSAVFRSSAYPRLERVVALANSCNESTIRIAGHTDTSGPEAWNRELSLKRANAVGDYIIRRGIDAGRLRISGRGSAFPIANNATRYGRSLNRRIEIKFHP